MSSDPNAHEMRLTKAGKVTCSCSPRRVFLDDRAVRDHAEWAEEHYTLVMPDALSSRLAATGGAS